jgi:hypothetical protein
MLASNAALQYVSYPTQVFVYTTWKQIATDIYIISLFPNNKLL